MFRDCLPTDSYSMHFITRQLAAPGADVLTDADLVLELAYCRARRAGRCEVPSLAIAVDALTHANL